MSEPLLGEVAINGLGRIGRAVFKIILDTPELELVAVNDLVPPDNLAYLLKYDTVYGKYSRQVDRNGNSLIIAGKEYKYFQEKDPETLPWKDLDIDVVFECTGVFRQQEDLKKHLKAGAKKVVLSAPAKSEGIEVVVPGVSQSDDKDNPLISCASCTTNCIAPVVEIMNRRIGVKKAIMTTIHAYTASQGLVDQPSKKFRRGRTAAANLVPTTTGAAIATTKVLPELADKFDGVAVRTPVPVGSISDIVGDARASIIDLTMTQVVDGDLIKIMSWYDNEWGYANQMVRQVVSS